MLGKLSLSAFLFLGFATLASAQAARHVTLSGAWAGARRAIPMIALGVGIVRYFV